MTNSFKNCPNLSIVDFTSESDLSKVTTINDCFNGDSSLTSLINLKITNANTTANNTTLKDCPLNDTEGLYINSNASLNMFRMGASSKITQITELNLGANADDLHDLCMDYPLLVVDFVIPKNVKTVQNLFKNCVAMENVTSNWRTLYDRNRDNDVTNDVITTDCYKGCINSKYIDGDLYLDEYSNPTVMKNIPVEWGGEITYPSNLTVFDVRITEDNLTYSLVGNVADANTNWGDGSEDMNPSHTYAKAGIYTIATGNLTTFATGSIINEAVSSPIIRFRQLSPSLTNGSHLFDSWRNLMILDGINHNLSTYEYLCNNCTSLTNDILFPATARNVTKAFYGCANITHIHSNWKNTYNNGIVSTDCYAGCINITHIDDIDLGINEYRNGLDEIPLAWGGREFTKEYTGIYRIKITEDMMTDGKYLFTTYSDSTSNTWSLIGNKIVNWGDGTVTTGEGTHYYTSPGEYVIKGNTTLTRPGLGAHGHVRNCLIEVIQYPTSVTGYAEFYMCTKLVKANVSGAKLKGYCFRGCSSMIEVNVTDCTFIESIDGLFNRCRALTNEGLIGFETVKLNNVKIMSSVFIECDSLETIDLSNWDVGNVTNLNNLVRDCRKLANFIPPKNINVSISNFTNCTLLPVEQLVSIINNLATVSTTQTLTLGSTNLAKLTTEQIQIATDKGWTVS